MLASPNEDDLAGLGLAIEVNKIGECRVLHTVVGGAAHTCGKITAGDILVGVLDRQISETMISTVGLDFHAIRKMIIGRRGTKVTLELKRGDGNGQDVYVCENLIRGLVQPQSILPRSQPNQLSFLPAFLSHTTSLQAGEGVGIALELKDGADFPLVSALIDGRSAKASGKIEIGDLLVSVDGKSIEKKTFAEIRAMIGGPVGTHVSLGFKGQNGFYQCDKLIRGDLARLGLQPTNASSKNDVSSTENTINPFNTENVVDSLQTKQNAVERSQPVRLQEPERAVPAEGGAEEEDNLNLFGADGTPVRQAVDAPSYSEPEQVGGSNGHVKEPGPGSSVKEKVSMFERKAEETVTPKRLKSEAGQNSTAEKAKWEIEQQTQAEQLRLPEAGSPRPQPAGNTERETDSASEQEARVAESSIQPQIDVPAPLMAHLPTSKGVVKGGSSRWLLRSLLPLSAAAALVGLVVFSRTRHH